MWRLSLLALASCNAVLGVHDFAPPDAPADAAIDARSIDALPCIGSAMAPLKQCGVDDGSTVTLSNQYSTTTCEKGTRDTSVTPPRCVIFARDIDAQNVTVIGDASLVLFASDAITIGSLDGSSSKQTSGPGASAAVCPAGDGGNGMFSNGGGGGGGGGSLATKGGVGGMGETGATGGSPSATLAGTFQPGCAGGKGGPPTSGPSPTAPGIGGGAIYLASSGTISISNHILANGGPGLGGQSRFGGSGAGAGGSIFLDAPNITCSLSPCLFANGGGGGGGGGAATGGEDGETSSNNGMPANGGMGGNGGAAGHGGLGNSGNNDGQFGGKGPGGNQYNAGGGGGGGAGQIVIYGTTQQISASPPAKSGG